jgi:hypothetical protein
MNGPSDAGRPTGRPRMRGDARINAFLVHVARTLSEMEQGLRPVAALDHHLSRPAARRLRTVVLGAQHRTGRTPRTVRRTAPTRVLSASSAHPTAGVTEGVVVLAVDGRARPYCVRMEQEGAQWRIVELMPPDLGLRPVVTRASRTGGLPDTEPDAKRDPKRDPKSGRARAVAGTDAADPAHEDRTPHDPEEQEPSGATG